MSVVSAVITKYSTLSFSISRPVIYFDLVPTKDLNSNPVVLPWVVIKDRGMRIEYEFEYHPFETTTLDIEVYCVTLADVDSCVETIKYGGSPATQSGFDFGTLTLTPKTFKKCERVNEQRDLQTVQSETVQLVHRAVLTYEIQAVYQF